MVQNTVLTAETAGTPVSLQAITDAIITNSYTAKRNLIPEVNVVVHRQCYNAEGNLIVVGCQKLDFRPYLVQLSTEEIFDFNDDPNSYADVMASEVDDGEGQLYHGVTDVEGPGQQKIDLFLEYLREAGQTEVTRGGLHNLSNCQLAKIFENAAHITRPMIAARDARAINLARSTIASILRRATLLGDGDAQAEILAPWLERNT